VWVTRKPSSNHLWRGLCLIIRCSCLSSRLWTQGTCCIILILLRRTRILFRRRFIRVSLWCISITIRLKRSQMGYFKESARITTKAQKHSCSLKAMTCSTNSLVSINDIHKMNEEEELFSRSEAFLNYKCFEYFLHFFQI
jgi:hypothetical protein